MFDEVLKEPVPGEFLDLLQKIDDSGTSGKTDS